MAPRLKSLELHGYKTFASRTLFEFPGDITAIVGPNGSGKSNVADSMRWVLGEQSYSLLRGRKTEDMIFAGSEQRPRAGMASSSIVFDNSDGWLPIDFSEVAITRRAYRDGTNEYLLNGQRVRLKEISELLAQSGLAERTYTIIGQGLVDAALALKPEERRRFFEEAAGISLYRSRREESLNKLDATRRNLERVQDILSELEPRLNSLEKQARKVQEYERIKADLQILLRDWYGYHWQRNQKELSHALEAQRVQENRLDQARQRQYALDKEIAELRASLQEQRVNLNAWHNDIAGLHTRREQISRKLAVLDERQQALISRQAALNSDIVTIEEEIGRRRERLDATLAEVEGLKADLAEAEAGATEATGALNKRESERAQAEKQLREMRRGVVEAEMRQVQIRARQDELRNRIADQNKTQASLAQAVQHGEKLTQQAAQKLEDAQRLRQEHEATRKRVETELQTAQQELRTLENRRREILAERATLEAQRTRARAELDVLEQAERSLSGMNSGSKNVLQAARQGRLKGGYASLSSLLDVPQELETAISACLGEMLDGIFLDSGAELDAVLTLLETGEKGRAILFPQGTTREIEPLTAPGDADCLGIAADLVRAPENIAATLRLLLGRVLVVRNRQAARRLMLTLPADAHLVTLRGEVFWGSGMVTAGQESRAATAIARPRQKRELQDALAGLESSLAALNMQMRETDAGVNRQQETVKGLESSLRQANQMLSQVTQAHQQAVLAAEQTRQRQEWQVNQLNSLVEQLQRSDKEIQQGQNDLKEIDSRIAATQERVRESSRALAALPLEELQAQVVHWNTQTAVTRRAVKDASSRADEYRQALESSQRRKIELTQRQSETEGQLKTLDTERGEAHEQEVELNRAIDTLQAQITPAEDALQEMERKHNDVQSNQTIAQQAVTVAERYTTQTLLELGHIRETIASLKRRIEEDFGIVAFEVAGDSAQTPLPLDGIVEELPVVEDLASEVEESITRQRAQLRRLGAVNFEAQTEYLSVKERHAFLTGQVADLHKADADLRQVIQELDELIKREFRRTFDAVALEFKTLFTRLFGGGSAHLVLTDEDHPTETGIDIEARLPGRREHGLMLLSGGERSLTAVALVFSLLKVAPTPFCILDEVDAMLDEANVGRFRDLLKELSEKTQFIVITHNRNTVQAADVIYGITMGKDTASQTISLRLDEVSEEMAK